MIRELFAGAEQTLALFFSAWVVGFPLGLLAAILGFNSPVVRATWRVMAVALAVIPLLAVLYWAHYPLQTSLAVVWPPNFTASAVLAFFTTFTVADILGEAFTVCERRYGETIKVLGVPRGEYFRKVLGPVSIYLALPRLLTLAILTIHFTMFASLIGVEELFRVVQRLNAQMLKPVELYTALAASYAVLCLPLYLAANYLNERLARGGGHA